MPISKEKKKEWVDFLKERLTSTNSVWIAGYQGLNANEFNEVRRIIREMGGELKVVKNRIFKRILEGEWEGLTDFVEGPTAVIFGAGDGVELVKRLNKLEEEFSPFHLRGGYFEGRIMGREEVGALARLPSREVLLAQVASGMVTPIFKLQTLLRELLSGLVRVVEGWREKKEKEEVKNGEKTQ